MSSSPFLDFGETSEALNFIGLTCLIIPTYSLTFRTTQRHYFSTFSNVQCLEPLIKPAIISATHLWVLSWESDTRRSKWGWRTGKKASSKFLKRPCKTRCERVFSNYQSKLSSLEECMIVKDFRFQYTESEITLLF